MNLSDLNFKDLELLAALPTLRSVRSKARELHISAQALSKNLQRLEEILGVSLLQRSSVGVTPTSDAQDFALWARTILAQAELLPKQQGELQKNSKLPLTIGTRAFLNTSLASSFVQIEEEISWRFIDLSPHDTLEAARRGGIQIAITLGKLNFGESWKTEKVGEMPWALYVRQSHPLPANPTKEDLLHYPFTFATYWDGTGVVRGEDFIPLEKRYKNWGHGIQTAQTAIEVARNSLHIVNVPKLLAHEFVNRNELREVFLKGMKPQIHDVYLSVQMDGVPEKLYRKIKSQLAAKFREGQK